MPGGKIRLANARLKIAPNSESSPPMPMSWNLKLGLMMAFGAARLALALILSVASGCFWTLTPVLAMTMPICIAPARGDEAPLDSTSTGRAPVTVARSFSPFISKTRGWPTVNMTES